MEIPLRQLKTKYSNIKIKGKSFDNLTQACKYFKVGYSFISNRIHVQGMSVEDAFLNSFKVQKITLEGITYKSIRNVCNHYNILEGTVYYRLNKGWSLEEALEIIERKDISKCKGIIYKISNKINSKIYIGLTTMSLNHRFEAHKRNAKNGKETKFCRALRKYGTHNFRIKAIRYTNDRHKLPKLEKYYIKKYNSIEEGYNTAKGGGSTGDRHGHKIVFEDRTFISHSALARHLGLSVNALKNRIKNNLPLRVKIGKGGTKGNKIVYRNKIYNSVKELGEHLGMSKSGIHYRLKMGYCLNGPSKHTGRKGYYIGKLI